MLVIVNDQLHVIEIHQSSHNSLSNLLYNLLRRFYAMTLYHPYSQCFSRAAHFQKKSKKNCKVCLCCSKLYKLYKDSYLKMYCSWKTLTLSDVLVIAAKMSYNWAWALHGELALRPRRQSPLLPPPLLLRLAPSTGLQLIWSRLIEQILRSFALGSEDWTDYWLRTSFPQYRATSEY